MERLTAWSDYGAYFPKCYEEPCDGNGTENDCDNCGFMDDVCRKLAQYEDIGTLEEVREAVEKQMPKSPTYDGDGYAPDGTFVWDEWLCPNCGHSFEVEYEEHDYCPNCGQHILWEVEDER